jgi:PAS domain S-box-containing protein
MLSMGRNEFLMTQKRPRLPGSDGTSGRRLAERIADARLRLRVMRPSFVSLLMRPTAPPIWLGIVVAASLMVIETVAVVYLRQLTGKPFGTLYMIDVLVVSTVWGFGLSSITSVISAMAYAYFRTWPNTHFGPTELSFWLSIGVFLFVALLANTIAAVARTGERFSDLSSDLLAIAGPDRFIRMNRACERILGYSEDEMTSQPWINLVEPEDRDRVRSMFGRFAGSTEPARFESRMIRKDGSWRWVEWDVVWHGGLAYAIGRDVTERRREQDQLHQTRTMLEASRDGLSVLVKQQEALYAEVAASRARIVATADQTRRQIERDLHDGAQQRLVSLILKLGMARADVPTEEGELQMRLGDAIEQARGALKELRDLSRGIHPAILTEDGLGRALRALTRRSPISVQLDQRIEERLPDQVEISAYYIVAEALTNAAKHSGASAITVTVERDRAHGALCLQIADNGVGGAEFTGGTGLLGIKDRVEALGGQINLHSPRGAGTDLRVTLPLTQANGDTSGYSHAQPTAAR